jgi:glycosyltransferase involved in cell wall biosynthesis
MKVLLVTPRYATRPGVFERHVRRLAHGLAGRGATVEVLTQGGARGRRLVTEADGVLVRRFSPPAGNARIVAPALWEHLRWRAATYDVVHLHGAHVGLGLAVARARLRRFIFTPHAPIEHLCRWSYARVLQTVVGRASLAICASRAEADLLSRALPTAADRVRVVPNGVDVAEIQAASPFDDIANVVLAVGRLERHAGMARAIAAMASLGPAFRLVVVGDGPARRSLQAHAADLRVRSRVLFTGLVTDAVLHRWLRTAAVVVALGERPASGVQVLEAVSAGAPVVASATPTHLELAAYLDERAVLLVSPTGSPLEVADAVAAAAAARARPTAQADVPTWDAVVERTYALYRGLVLNHAPSASNAWVAPGRAGDRGARPHAAVEA